MKSNIIYIIVLGCLCLSNVRIHAQFDKHLDQYVPQTPTAASFTKFSEAPVDFFSGTVPVNIPLEQVSSKGLSTSVSLRYHGSGIKASEVASSAGLGWNLNAGGVITRSIRGGTDERVYGSEIQISGYYSDGVDPSWLGTDDPQTLNDLAIGKLDTESDVYHYNFDGYSGSFYFKNENGVVEVIQKQKTDIKIIPVDITGFQYNKLRWKIIIPDGTIYYFGGVPGETDYKNDAVSYTNNYNQPCNQIGDPSPRPLPDSWYLVKIESFDGTAEIEFDYEFEAYSFRNMGTAPFLYLDNSGSNLVTDVGNFSSLNPVLVTDALSPRIKSITTDNRFIRFSYTGDDIYSFPRKDVINEREELNIPYYFSVAHPKYLISPDQVYKAGYLSGIQVQSTENSTDALYSYIVNQSYFTSDTDVLIDCVINAAFELNYAGINYHPDELRLKNNGIVLKDKEGEVVKEWKFEYESNTMQRRLTYGQDAYGYPNGKATNQTLVPEITLYDNVEDPPIIDLEGYADRSSSFEETKKPMLSKITFPTGGTRTFEYEPHDVHEARPQTSTNTIENFHNCSSPDSPCPSGEYTSDWVQMIDGTSTSYKVVITAKRAANDNIDEPAFVDLIVYTADGYVCESGCQNGLPLELNEENEYCDKRTIQLFELPQTSNGDYQFSLVPQTVRGLFLEIQIIQTSVEEVTQNYTIPGTRIKSVVDDPKIGPSIVRSFEYLDQESQTESSGFLVGKNNYFEKYPDGAGLVILSAGCVANLRYKLNTGNSFSRASVQGHYIGYERVVERIGTNQGYNEFIYNIDENHELNYVEDWIALREVFMDPIAGLLKEKNIYSQSEELIGQEIYDYELVEINNSNEYFYEYLPTCTNYSGGGVDWQFFFGYREFTNPSHYVANTSITKILDNVTSTTSNSFDLLPEYTFLTASSTTNSDGTAYSTEYKYNNEYENVNQQNQLVLQHRLLPAWQTTQKAGNTLIGGSKIQYGNFSGNLYPNIVSSYKAEMSNGQTTGGTWDIDAIIDQYDLNVGRPELVTNPGFETVEYTWTETANMATKSYLDHHTNYVYNDADLISEVINPDNTKVKIFYDEVLRTSKIETYGSAGSLKSTETYDYVYALPNEVNSDLTYSDGTPTKSTKKTFDGLGRPVEDIAIDFANGADVTTNWNTYDELGRIESSSILANKHQQTLSYYPDPLNRVQSISFPGGGSVSYEYSNQGNFYETTVTDENGNPSTEVKDILGRITQSIDPEGGTTSYTYYENGQVYSIHSPNGNVYDYDYIWGNLIAKKTIPAQTGSHIFNYNPDTKLLTSTTDPNGNQLSYTHDAYGREKSVLLNGQLISESFFDSYAGVGYNPGSSGSNLIGKNVANKVALMNGESPGAMLWLSSHFDEFGRETDIFSQTHDGKDQVVNLDLNHADLPNETMHSFDGSSYTFSSVFDTWDREEQIAISLTGLNSSTVLCKNQYNAEGLLAEKTLNNLQSLDYNYNSRGWLRTINQNLVPFALPESLPSCSPIDADPSTLSPDPVEASTVTISQLLDMRFEVDMITPGTSEEQCETVPCPDVEGCDNTDIPSQIISIENIIETINTEVSTTQEVACEVDGVVTVIEQEVIDISLIALPLEVKRVRLCNGAEYYILSSYLDQISGAYDIVQTIQITNYDQVFNLEQSGEFITLDLTEFIDYILHGQESGSNVSIDDYIQCGMEECETIELGCTNAEIAEQEIALDLLAQSYEFLDIENLEFPLTLYSVALCDGQVFWVLDSELDIISNTTIEILDELIISDPEQEIEIVDPITDLDKLDLFCMQLDYEPNGNIKNQIWQVSGRAIMNYAYGYDPLNRIKSAEFSELFAGDGGVLMQTTENRFGVFDLNYDADGNISSLSRNGINGYCADGSPEYGPIDALSYSYYGNNRLGSVTDATNSPYGFPGGTGSYNYDNNGNMTNDPYRDVDDISYNFLNLPYQISGTNAQVDLLYDAASTKRQRISTDLDGNNKTVDYYGSIEYIDGAFSAFYHNDGRITKDDKGNWQFEYAIKDHLGNTRLMFYDANGDGKVKVREEVEEVMQEKHYYPFGMAYESSERSPWYKYEEKPNGNKYLYNGKEEFDEVFKFDTGEKLKIGLGWLAYGFRFYDPAIGRFTSVDPLAHRGPGISPYAYSFNNPINFTDPDGRWPYPVIPGWARTANKVFRGIGSGLSDMLNSAVDNYSYQGKANARLAAANAPPDNKTTSYKAVEAVVGPVVGMVEEGVDAFSSGDAEQMANFTTKVAVTAAITKKMMPKAPIVVPKGVSKAIHQGKQGKHIAGHNNFISGKSELTANATSLLDDLHGGRVKSVQAINDVKTRVNFGSVIGDYINPSTGVRTPTSVGIVNSSKSGAHIVPARPIE